MKGPEETIVLSSVCDIVYKICKFYWTLMDSCIYDDIKFFAITDYRLRLLQFKHSKLSQVLHVDKTGFLRPDHIFEICIIHCQIAQYARTFKVCLKACMD